MRRTALMVLFVLVGCGRDSEPAQESARVGCEKYREHLLDVRLRGVSEHREEHRAALRASLGDDFVARCELNATQADLDCAMAANTTEQLRRCSSQR